MGLTVNPLPSGRHRGGSPPPLYKLVQRVYSIWVGWHARLAGVHDGVLDASSPGAGPLRERVRRVRLAANALAQTGGTPRARKSAHAAPRGSRCGRFAPYSSGKCPHLRRDRRVCALFRVPARAGASRGVQNRARAGKRVEVRWIGTVGEQESSGPHARSSRVLDLAPLASHRRGPTAARPQTPTLTSSFNGITILSAHTPIALPKTQRIRAPTGGHEQQRRTTCPNPSPPPRPSSSSAPESTACRPPGTPPRTAPTCSSSTRPTSRPARRASPAA